MEHTKNYIFIRKLLSLISYLTFFLFLDPIGTKAQTAGEELILSLRNNVVSITAERKDGTHYGFGFIIGERGKKLFIATANHVVRSDGPEEVSSNVKVKFFSEQGKTYPAILLETSDMSYDLAVLEADFPQDFKWIRDSLGSEDSIKRGTQVWFIGRNGQWYVPTEPGRINNVGLDSRISIDRLDVQVGTSGAPLIAGSGIIGMVRSDEPGNISKAISIHIIKRALDQWNLPWNLMQARKTSTKVSPERRIPSPGIIFDISGKWSHAHGYLAFIKVGDNFEYIEYNFKDIVVGEGKAILNGDKLVLQGTNLSMGTYSGKLQIIDNKISGNLIFSDGISSQVHLMR